MILIIFPPFLYICSPICQDPEINAIVTVKDNTTYVFKDKLYYKLSDDSVADGYPRLVFDIYYFYCDFSSLFYIFLKTLKVHFF